jgi:hypothetical protein
MKKKTSSSEEDEEEAWSSEEGEDDDDVYIKVNDDEEVAGPHVDRELTTSTKASSVPQLTSMETAKSSTNKLCPP